MKYTVVTSFSDKGFEQYGRRFIETFEKYWPEGIELIIYHEGIDNELVNRHTNFNLLKELSCWAFLSRYSENPLYSGKEVNKPVAWKSKCINDGYNYRFDAIKFVKKVFAIESAAKLVDTGKLFWVDADIVTFGKITKEFLDETLPDHTEMSFLARPDSYSECGFVGYNLDFARTLDFIDKFSSVYSCGSVFSMHEWHDSYVFDRIRNGMGIKGYAIPAETDRGHVFINSILGQYMDHLKGDRKDIGHSNKNEIKTNHNILYWDEVKRK